MRVGLSTHGPPEAGRAIRAAADYIAIGPVYATKTKPTAQPVTLEYVRWAAEHVQVPWFAIGGITLENLGEVLAAGASRVCVVSAILNAKDVEGTCRNFKTKIEELLHTRR
jgi:thiamine-phosphate pyrophosphorylase